MCDSRKSFRSELQTHRCEERHFRITEANDHANQPIKMNLNPDLRKRRYHALFTKSLSHSEDGEVDPKQFRSMYRAVTKSPRYLVDIDYPNQARLVNPSAMFSMDLIGGYKSSFRVPKVPTFSSKEAAGEMVELYWMSLLRDIPFDRWVSSDTDPLVLEACSELSKLSVFKGPTVRGKVTPPLLFRGNSKGDLVGPYVSQFLIQSYNQGAQTINQKYDCYRPYSDPVSGWSQILDLQNGKVPSKIKPFGLAHYISSLRDGASYVHHDTPVTSGLNALNLLYTIGCNPNPGLVGVKKYEDPFVNCGPGDIYDLLTRASHVALLTAWYCKWSILRLRPEVYGMWVDEARSGPVNNKNIPNDLLNSKVLKKILKKQKNYTLSLAYPEGSPCHPAYPAGHATFSGAVVTVLKAFFDQDYPIDLYVPNSDGTKLVPTGKKSTVGLELDKMASNIALFRNAAGVHYRSDALGIELGEHVAVELLREHFKRYPSSIRVTIKLRHGETITITN